MQVLTVYFKYMRCRRAYGLTGCSDRRGTLVSNLDATTFPWGRLSCILKWAGLLGICLAHKEGECSGPSRGLSGQLGKEFLVELSAFPLSALFRECDFPGFGDVRAPQAAVLPRGEAL